MSKYKHSQDLDNTKIRLKQEIKLGRTEGEPNRDISDYIMKFSSSQYSRNGNQRGTWRGYRNHWERKNGRKNKEDVDAKINTK